MKKLKRIIEIYIWSWDFLLSIFFTVFFISFLLLSNNSFTTLMIKDITKNFGYYIPILSIFITIFTLTMTVLITTISERFLKYLEEHGNVFTTLKNAHIVGFIIYFIAIIFNLILQIGFNFKSEIKYLIIEFGLNSSKEIILLIPYVITIFFTIYSFFYTISLIFLVSKLMDYRIEFEKKYSWTNKSK